MKAILVDFIPTIQIKRNLLNVKGRRLFPPISSIAIKFMKPCLAWAFYLLTNVIKIRLEKK